MRQFHEQLQQLFLKVVMMGSLSESMIALAMRVLKDGNQDLLPEIRATEHRVNDLQVEVDNQAVRLTALQQPVAEDVRFLFMASRIGGELERIGDQAVNISQNAHFVLTATPPIKPPVELPVMADLAQRMVRDTLSAMMSRDVALANRVLEEEDQVDAFRDRNFRILLDQMRNDPRIVQPGMSMILIARNLERIGDHASNIAEEVVYWVQGRDIRHRKSSAPASSSPSPQPSPPLPTP